MRYKLISFCALFLLMLITGAFWGTWFTLTRSIQDFSSGEFIHIGQTIISNVAVPMRIIMPSGIVFMFLALWFTGKKRTKGFIPGIISLVLIISALLITVIILVPIDNNIKTWSSSLPPAWTGIREKWALFHALRTFLSLASFAFFSVFMLTNSKSN